MRRPEAREGRCRKRCPRAEQHTPPSRAGLAAVLAAAPCHGACSRDQQKAWPIAERVEEPCLGIGDDPSNRGEPTPLNGRLDGPAFDLTSHAGEPGAEGRSRKVDLRRRCRMLDRGHHRLDVDRATGPIGQGRAALTAGELPPLFVEHKGPGGGATAVDPDHCPSHHACCSL